MGSKDRKFSLLTFLFFHHISRNCYNFAALFAYHDYLQTSHHDRQQHEEANNISYSMMNNLNRIILKQGKEKSVLRRHPWIFSGAIARKEQQLHDGDVVEVYGSQGDYLATGFYHNNTIAVRIFSFNQCLPDHKFWQGKLKDAIDYRKSLSLPNFTTNMFRLINGEGDDFSGLVVDIFDNHVVMQFHSMGMYNIRDILIDNIKNLIPNVKAIYIKNAIENVDSFQDGWVFGTLDERIIASENGVRFVVDVENGQKTGFFLDQRDSRALVGTLSEGRNVLNMFCYSGGFSLYALKNGAKHVDSVDISRKAISLVDENVDLLGKEYSDKHKSHCEDVFAFLDKMPDDYYDLIVLDPPAFAKHHRVKEQGIKGYRNINKKAMEKIKHGGFLFTFSCSQAVGRDDFQTAIFSAAAISGKEVRIVQHLQQSPDHPINIYHPEGEYLKGLLLQVR